MSINFNEVMYEMSSPNQEFIFLEGEFTLKNSYVEFKADGKIFVSWSPRHVVRFEGTTNIEAGTTDLFSLFMDAPQVIVNGYELGYASLGDNKDQYIFGKIYNLRPIGSVDLAVESIRFAIPNMKRIENLPLRNGYILKTPRSHELLLDDDIFKIKIIPASNIEQLKGNITVEGGYFLSHKGELTSYNGVISFDEKTEILECFNYFLNFLTGSRTYAIMIQGITDERPLWIDYRQSKNNPHQDVISWSPSWDMGFNGLWLHFRKLWKEDNSREILKNVIYWYVEANMNTSQLEGFIVMAQAALEALFTLIKIERNLDIKPDKIKQLDNMSAESKIHSLLTHIDVSTTIPSSLKNLNAAGRNFKHGHKVITEVRNALTHGNKSKRDWLRTIDVKAKVEVSRLAIWYIELVLLHELEYKGQYHSRCSESYLFQNSLEALPFNR